MQRGGLLFGYFSLSSKHGAAYTFVRIRKLLFSLVFSANTEDQLDQRHPYKRDPFDVSEKSITLSICPGPSWLCVKVRISLFCRFSNCLVERSTKKTGLTLYCQTYHYFSVHGAICTLSCKIISIEHLYTSINKKYRLQVFRSFILHELLAMANVIFLLLLIIRTYRFVLLDFVTYEYMSY